jgi:hypothetical protein
MAAGGTLRNVLRWTILAAGVAIAAWLLPDFRANWRAWLAARGSDPSAAELYSDGCLIDGGMAIGSLGVASILFYFLGPDAADSSGKRK